MYSVRPMRGRKLTFRLNNEVIQNAKNLDLILLFPYKQDHILF